MPIKREFIAAKEITLITKYCLVPGTDSSGVYINGMTCFTVELTYQSVNYMHTFTYRSFTMLTTVCFFNGYLLLSVYLLININSIVCGNMLVLNLTSV